MTGSFFYALGVVDLWAGAPAYMQFACIHLPFDYGLVIQQTRAPCFQAFMPWQIVNSIAGWTKIRPILRIFNATGSLARRSGFPASPPESTEEVSLRLTLYYFQK